MSTCSAIPSFSSSEFMTSRLSGDQTVAPAVCVLIEFDSLAQRGIFSFRAEKRKLFIVVSIFLADGFKDCAWVHAFVNVKRHGRHLEAGALRLPSPLQRRIKMRIIGVGSFLRVLVGLRRHEADGRIVHPLLFRMTVLLNRSFVALRAFCSCHECERLPSASYTARNQGFFSSHPRHNFLTLPLAMCQPEVGRDYFGCGMMERMTYSSPSILK